MRILFLLTLMASLAVAGCTTGTAGSGAKKSELRPQGAFSAIELAGAFKVVIETGKEPHGVTITTDENLLPLIITEVTNGVLKVYPKSAIAPSKGIELIITMKDLAGLSCSGAGRISTSDLKSTDLKLDFSGAAEFDATGEANSLQINVSGAANLRTKDLKAGKVTIAMSGAGSAAVFARDELKATVTGVGAIDYYGNPAKVEPQISGLGKINKKD